MKKIFQLSLISLLFSLNSFAAKTLTCKKEYQGYDNFNAAFETRKSYCNDKKGRGFAVTFIGHGPFFQLDNYEDFVIMCPLVKQKSIEGSYFGIKILAGAVIGGGLNLSFGKNFKTCLIAGKFDGIGAGAVIEQMIIEDVYAEYGYVDSFIIDNH